MLARALEKSISMKRGGPAIKFRDNVICTSSLHTTHFLTILLILFLVINSKSMIHMRDKHTKKKSWFLFFCLKPFVFNYKLFYEATNMWNTMVLI
jgi:hypothetical protein